jgi:tetratricopeptide (TPR) repeat protein
MEEENKPLEFISISSLSASELLLQAESAFSALQYPLALSFYSQAYSLAPQNEELLCSFANFLSETGDLKNADKILKEALQIESSTNYKKYMQMAELSNGKLGLELNLKGVAIMETLVNYIL